MGVPYDAIALERKWQSRWAESGAHTPDIAAAAAAGRRVFFNLVEFPYPSGEGLHVGHVFKYTGADVVGRYRRMLGDVVVQPMGWDSFGINAENYARRIGEHPAPVIERTTARFRRQLAATGGMWDWSRQIATSDPAYYRWTQWLFLRLFDAGLAYRAEAPVTWCPSCETVLAREQVDDEACERCATPVRERVLTQWFVRTTAFRERLRTGLDDLDWPAWAKRTQGRWIDGLHDWLVSRQRYWGAPVPIVHCPSCGEVPVPDGELPVALPPVAAPLASQASWLSTSCPRCGGRARRDSDVLDTFVDSSWYFLRYTAPGDVSRPWDPDAVAAALPAALYAGGREHVRRHHLYARFVCMALYDLGLVPFAEPFPTVRYGGLIVADGAKMSKSRGNVVEPDDLIAAHGADVVRLHLLFSARWTDGGEFRTDGIAGVERFLSKLWRRVVDRAEMSGTAAPDRAVAAVTRSIETMSFNVGVARLMEAARDVDADVVVRLLAPFAPHVAEELWERIGAEASVFDAPWPGDGRRSPA